MEDRFEIQRLLGRGGQGETFLAIDRASGQEVALKRLVLSRAEDWKSIELFEREAQVLRSLDHPGIPRYIDSFTDDQGTLSLIQEYVEGQSLQQWLDEGKSMSEIEARAFLLEMLGILEYLHHFSPPVVHRDIKPANILRRLDGRHVLLDFGAVQQVVQGRIGGSTMVGTGGFLAPEQLMGRAMPASDLYALGVTVIYLMCGIHPVDLPVTHMKITFADRVTASPRFLSLLESMVEPYVEDRPVDVPKMREILLRLQGGQRALTTASKSRAVTNYGSFELGPHVRLERSPNLLSVQSRANYSFAFRILCALGLLLTSALVVSYYSGPPLYRLLVLGFAILACLFAGAYFTARAELHIDRHRYEFEEWALGIRTAHLTGSVANLYKATLEPGNSAGKAPQVRLIAAQGVRDCGFKLESDDRMFVTHQINEFLAEQERE